MRGNSCRFSHDFLGDESLVPSNFSMDDGHSSAPADGVPPERGAIGGPTPRSGPDSLSTMPFPASFAGSALHEVAGDMGPQMGPHGRCVIL